MNYLKLSELVGKEILDLTCHYTSEDDYGLQTFNTFIKLESDTIIEIPKSDDDDYLQLTQENRDYLKEMFATGSSIDKRLKKHLVGQRIMDFCFRYYNNHVEFDTASFISLSNGYFFTEKIACPLGLADVGLMILSKEQFDQKVKKLGLSCQTKW